MQSETAVRKI